MWSQSKRAVRSLRQSPWTSAFIVLMLGVGIGATTTLTSVVDTVLLEPLPYPDPDRLVRIFQRAPDSGIAEDGMSPPQLRDIREQSTVFEDLGLFISSPIMLNREAAAEHSRLLWMSSSALHLLGLTPQIGRVLTEEDDRAGAPFVMILSHELWTRRYGADPDIIGRRVGVESGSEVEVVGVLKPRALLPLEQLASEGHIEHYGVVGNIPLTAEHRADRGRELYRILGKLGPGRTLAEARAELDVIAARMLEAHPPLIAEDSFSIEAMRLVDHAVARVRPAIYWILAASWLVLLIAVANVATLLLARAKRRSGETGLCLALGASRRRVVSELVLESALLESLAVALGLGLAAASFDLFRAFGPSDVPRLVSIELDATSFATAAGLAAFALLASNVVPALRVSRLDPRQALSRTSRLGGVLQKRLDASSAFVVAQIAVAFVLLAGAGLLTRSLSALTAIDPGFDPSGTLTVFFQERTDTGRAQAELLDRLRTLPGVTAVGAGGPLPFTRGDWWGPFEIEGMDRAPDDTAIALRRAVTNGYFEAMDIALVEGRRFHRRDFEPDAPPVRIVDRIFADRFWPESSPLGARVSGRDRGERQEDVELATIVGVVDHVRHNALDGDGQMTLYLPATSWDRTYLVLRTDGDPLELTRPTIDAIRALDPDIAVGDARTMQGRIDDHLAGSRLVLGLLHAFGWIALGLASLGLFALIARGVTDGIPEIGLRLALGGTPRDIVSLVMRHGVIVLVAGVAVGLSAALVAGRAVSGFLYGVRPDDGFTLGAVAAVLGAAALTACWLPAVRASRIHPMDALRSD